jgi:hypothetical protein
MLKRKRLKIKELDNQQRSPEQGNVQRLSKSSFSQTEPSRVQSYSGKSWHNICLML